VLAKAMPEPSTARRKQGSYIVPEGPDEFPLLQSADLATCLSMLQRQHDTVLHRLDLQDDLLEQLLSAPARSHPQPHLTREAGSGSSSQAMKQLSQRSDATSVERRSPPSPQPAATQSGAVSTFLNQLSSSFDHARRGDGTASRSTSTRTRLFKSYTNQELEKKRDAHSAEASRSRAMFSRNKQPLKADSGARCVDRLVDHPSFDVFFACVVLLNSILIGVDVENTLSCRDQPVCDARPAWLQATQISCTVLFVLELVIRVTASGIQIFCSEDWLWILLDVLIVALSVWEIVVDIALLVEPNQEAMSEGVSGIASLKAFRIIRLTRILKTAQLMRVFRFVMALRTLVQSVLHTMKALMWALLLLLLIVYVFAVLFTQTIHDHIYVDMLPMPTDAEVASDRYFGSLLDSMLSLFMSIAGGVSWEEVLLPLRHVSSAWIWISCFIFYISFTYFAVLNVVTAVFCQSAIESAQNDHATVVQNMLDNKESHLKKLRALFSKFDIQANGGITYGMFEEKLDSPAVREYFETLGLDVWDAWSFFKLLDQDGGGLVEIEEFFMGCLRFSGHARAMDVGKIIQDQGWIIRNQGRFHSYVEGELYKLHEHMNSLAVFLGSISRGVACEQL